MNFKLLLSIFLMSSVGLTAQTDSIETLEHDGETREYRLHLPPNYSAEANLPLVLNFHGYGSNAVQQEFYTGMNSLSNTENFVVVYPEGLLDAVGSQHFNVGFGGSEVDDVGFTEKLIDELVTNYGVDSTRVYSTGMSNGGFMSYKLACELGDKIAAIASVTGAMTPNEFANCEPAPIPVMQIHGTADATVPYDGGSVGVAIEDLVDFWIEQNMCDAIPEIIAIEDTDPDDGCTAELYKYTGGIYDYEVHFYKIEGGGHTWADAAFDIGVTNHDFDGNQAIWDFFKQYTNIIPEVPANNETLESLSFAVVPNPFEDQLRVEFLDNSRENMLKIYDISGKLLVQTTQNVIETGNLQAGVYILEVNNKNGASTQKVIKQ